MYLADYHTHSSVSPDGSVTVSELAQAAIDHGLDEICVTDHVDTILWGSHKPREDFGWPALQAQVDEARRRYGHRAEAGLCYRLDTPGRGKISAF